MGFEGERSRPEGGYNKRYWRGPGRARWELRPRAHPTAIYGSRLPFLREHSVTLRKPRRRLDEDEIGRLNEDDSRWGRGKRRRRGWKRRKREREREGKGKGYRRQTRREGARGLSGIFSKWFTASGNLHSLAWVIVGVSVSGEGGEGTILHSLPTAIEKVKHTPTRGHGTSRRERERVRHLPPFPFHVYKSVERGAPPSMRVKVGEHS